MSEKNDSRLHGACQEDATDRRAQSLSLTEKGQQGARQIEQFVDSLRRKVLTGISEEQLAATVELLGLVEQKLAHIEQNSRQ